MPEPPIVIKYTWEQHGLEETCQTWGAKYPDGMENPDGPHRTDGPAIVASAIGEPFMVLVWYENGKVLQHLMRHIQEQANARNQLRR